MYNNTPSYSKIIILTRPNASSSKYNFPVNGTSGEGPALRFTERLTLTEHWLNNRTKDSVIMIQVGGAPMDDVIEMARHAESKGADALLCLPDLYFKPTNCQQLLNYLKIIGEAAPNTPLLYYHIPMMTNVNCEFLKFYLSFYLTIINFF